MKTTGGGAALDPRSDQLENEESLLSPACWWSRIPGWEGYSVFWASAMIDMLKSAIRASQPNRIIADRTRELAAGEAIVATGLAGSLAPVVFSLLYEATGRQMLIVLGDTESAEQFRDDMVLLQGKERVSYFTGAGKHLPGEGGREVHDIQTLRALQSDPAQVVVTYAGALLASLPSPRLVAEDSVTMRRGEDVDFMQAVLRLQDLGFQRTDFVDAAGDYAVRGGILDAFSFVGENPLRLEFFGNTIDSIREFDAVSQRSIRELDAAVIVPDLLGRTTGPGDKASWLLDFLMPDAIVVLDDPDRIRAELAKATGEGRGHTDEEFNDVVGLFARIHMLPVRGLGPDSIDFAALPQPAFNGSVILLRESIASLLEKGYVVVITCDGHSEEQRLKELLTSIAPSSGIGYSEERGKSALDISRVMFSLEALHQGFVSAPSMLALFTEHQIFNRLKRRGGRKKPRFRGFTEKELVQLHRGDYVVHQDFGIGKFDRLQRIRVRNVEQEVVRVLYEGNDALYVNLNYVNKLQKYSSKEGHVPKLTRLGAPDWERLKSRAKKRVKDIARQLITLYAKRKHMTGFAFPKDTPWQKELEASFMYEDTFDQAKATLSVKEDMESPHPMDRLICGDVGFGKTEVAVRAAFKCVLGGKQAAMLVPTTILAMQHWNTVVDRTLRYGVSVELISRFKPKKEQEKILERLAAGAVDVIIGTHRLLSKDVSFKDLGLLIIDEEHRFGVAAKEKLRQLRVNVDTLALTATPIPRTLHFSLLGARDLSLIATPPRNRLPILTDITQWSDDLIRDAVHRELHRGGQVYFVHDRVQTIADVTDRLKKLVPGARIQYAHGQMHAHELEEAMLGFLEKRIDVLVSTKIIESGLDIPNVNTILINRADRFGMAELYQLRGRVGRSNVQAYAHLLIPPVSTLPTGTVRRLQAMQEFTELGSGFNLAMRDLEIRGAGNLLGAEQSGFIETMGFETYTKILEEAVHELKEQEFQGLFAATEEPVRRLHETVVEVEFDALIPETYVEDDIERLALYRRLYGLATPVQLEEVAAELKDRFGKLPVEVENLFDVVRIRLAAGRQGFRRVNVGTDSLEIEFPPETEVWFYERTEFQAIMSSAAQMKQHGVHFRQSGKVLKLLMKFDISGPHPFKQTLKLLDEISPQTQV
jgi:transcription-repair coupling factor (superfamily II helicase)